MKGSSMRDLNSSLAQTLEKEANNKWNIEKPQYMLNLEQTINP